MRILFVGDVAPIIRPEVDDQSYRPVAYGMDGDLGRLLDSGLAIGNLETSITDSREYESGKPVVYRMACPTRKGAPGIIEHFDYLSLANNHCLDYKAVGLRDTRRCLDDLGIAHSGAGRHLIEASRFVLLDRGHLRIALFSATDHPEHWEAGPDLPGVLLIRQDEEGLKSVDRILDGIRRAGGADLVIFSYHYGSNYQKDIDGYRGFFYRLLELGVDVIHGHSAHHINLVEFFPGKHNRFKKNCLIIYANGDFIDDYGFAVERDAEYLIHLGFVLELTITPGEGWAIKVHPTEINYEMEPSGHYYGDVKKATVRLVRDPFSDRIVRRIVRHGWR